MTSSWPSRPDWTPSACRPTSPIPSCTTPPTSSACWCCRTSRCSGDTPTRSAARPSGKCARQSTPSGTIRRSCSGAPTTNRWPTPRRWSTRALDDGSGASSPSSCRPGTSRSSTAGSSGRSSTLTRQRPAVAHSSVRPYLPRLDGTDTHLWLGWHRGNLGDLAERARLMHPRGALRQRVRVFSRSRTRPPRTSIPHAGRSSTGNRCREHHGLEVEVMQRARTSRRPTDLRLLAQRHPALPGHRAAPPHRDVATPQVPADGRVRLLVAGRSSADDLGGRPRPRRVPQARVVDDRRDLPPRHRRHRSPAT